ncbi:MAG: TonB-dependent receptor [Bacteroidetes bacterium 4572_77]|nr:MAG: TonB-dependent receptor [Bacteroidetes bacterium 4572_77]
MQSKYIQIIIIVFVLLANSISAEKPPLKLEISGHVSSNGAALPFASIQVKGTTIGAATNMDGHFSIIDIPKGDLVIMVSAVGYAPLEKKIALTENSGQNLHFDLKERMISTDEVVVSASRNSVKRKDAPVLVNTISPMLLQSIQANTLSDGLNFTPGLRVENDCQNCGFTQVRLNGLDGSYSQILINSRPIFSTMAGVYGLEQIPVNMIDKIEVIRGGGSALFGSNAIGGTINVITKDPLSNTYSIGSSFGSINGEAPEWNTNLSTSVVSEDYKSGMFLFGNVRRRDHWDANGDGFSEITEIKGNNLGLRAFYRPGNYSKINIDFGASEEYRRGGNAFEKKEDRADIAEMVDHNILNGGFTFDQYSQDAKNKFSAYTSGQYVDRYSYYGAEQDPSAYGQTYNLAMVAGLQETYYWDYLWFASAITTAGVEYLHESLNDKKLGYYDLVIDSAFENTTISDQQTNTYAAYLQNEWNWEKFKFLVGLRYDQVGVNDLAHPEAEKTVYPNWSPRVNFVYQPTKNLSLRANFSTGFRAPQIFSEDLHIEASAARKIIHINHPDLNPESSYSFTAGMDYDRSIKNGEIEFILEGFYTKLKDPFSSEFVFDEETKTLYDIRINASKGAIVSGVNLEINYVPNKKMDFQSGFTVQNSIYETPQQWGESEFSTSSQILRTPATYGYLVYSYYPTKKLSASMNLNYTGNMYVPHLGTPNKEEQLVSTKSFMDIGFQLAYKFTISKQTFLEVNAGVKNILNSYQDDFDNGIYRDAGYVYGPGMPRTFFVGVKMSNVL